MEIPPSTFAGKILRTLLHIAKFSIAVGIIAWMISKYGNGIGDSFRRIDGAWLALAALIYLLVQLAGALRFKILLAAQGMRIPFYESFSLLMIGNFLSLIIPGGAIGGDLPKAAILAAGREKGEKVKAVFTILIDRLMGMLGLFSLAFIAVLFCMGSLSKLGIAAELVVWVLVAGSGLGIASAAALFFHRSIQSIPGISHLIEFADKKSKGGISKLTDAIDAFKSRPGILFSALLISLLLVHLNLVFATICLAKGVGVEKIEFPYFLLAASLGNAAGTIPITPSGVGTRDIVMKTLFSAIGIGEQSAAIPILFTMLVLFFNLCGGIFLVLQKLPARATADAKAHPQTELSK